MDRGKDICWRVCPIGGFEANGCRISLAVGGRDVLVHFANAADAKLVHLCRADRPYVCDLSVFVVIVPNGAVEAQRAEGIGVVCERTDGKIHVVA